MVATVVKMTTEHALSVSQRMRDSDRREVMATRWTDSLLDFAYSAAHQPGGNWAALIEDDPIAIGGIALNQPGIGQAWMVGTDRFAEAALTLTRVCKEAVRLTLNSDSGIHRVQAHSALFHKESHEWLRLVGLTEYVRLPKYGKAGEDFILFYATRKDGG